MCIVENKLMLNKYIVFILFILLAKGSGFDQSTETVLINRQKQASVVKTIFAKRPAFNVKIECLSGVNEKNKVHHDNKCRNNEELGTCVARRV